MGRRIFGVWEHRWERNSREKLLLSFLVGVAPREEICCAFSCLDASKETSYVTIYRPYRIYASGRKQPPHCSRIFQFASLNRIHYLPLGGEFEENGGGPFSSFFSSFFSWIYIPSITNTKLMNLERIFDDKFVIRLEKKFNLKNVIFCSFYVLCDHTFFQSICYVYPLFQDRLEFLHLFIKSLIFLTTVKGYGILFLRNSRFFGFLTLASLSSPSEITWKVII